MKRLLILTMISIGFLCGCKPGGEASLTSSITPDAVISEGESYESIIERLGPPNISSRSQKSVVLIYDQVEIKLQSNAVVSVYDHR